MHEPVILSQVAAQSPSAYGWFLSTACSLHLSPVGIGVVCLPHACRDAAWDALSAGQARNLRPGMRVKLAGAVGRYLR